jgi:hypothetical protein
MDRSVSTSPEAERLPGCFFIGRNSRGNWVVQDADRRRGGLFVDHAAALKFARDEDLGRCAAVVHVTDVLELEIDSSISGNTSDSCNRSAPSSRAA